MNRATGSSVGPLSTSIALGQTYGIRPIGYRRAPGLAVTGRSDTPVRPRSSSAHPTIQRNGSKEAIPLTELSASAEYSQNSDQVSLITCSNIKYYFLLLFSFFRALIF